MDGPAGRPADNLPNSDWLVVYYWTVPELTVRVYWQAGSPIWQLFCSDPDLDPKWDSGTIANTRSSRNLQPDITGEEHLILLISIILKFVIITFTSVSDYNLFF